MSYSAMLKWGNKTIDVEIERCDNLYVYVKRKEDKMYLSAHEDMKHIFWTDEPSDWETWEITEDNHLYSWHYTYAFYDETNDNHWQCGSHKEYSTLQVIKPPTSKITDTPYVQSLMNEIESMLANVKLNKQYRDKTKKIRFNLNWSFMLGNTTGALGGGGMQTPHNMPHKKGKGVCVSKVEDRKLPKWKQALWAVSKELISIIDKDFSEGEYVVNYAKMTPGTYVKKHVDAEDISFQYAMALGDFKGAPLRCYDSNDQIIGDFYNRNKVLKVDGRLPHEVIMDDFQGTRYVVIWFKLYDYRKLVEDPILTTPCYV